MINPGLRSQRLASIDKEKPMTSIHASAIAPSGSWKLSRINTFLSDADLPIRLSCIGADGFPRVISLWYQFRMNTLFCVTHQSSQLVLLLKHCNRVGFEVSPNSPPYYGVRGTGLASLSELGSSPALDELIGRYLGSHESSLAQWLLSRRDEEILISIRPQTFFSWDYRKRMSNTVQPD